MGTEKNIADLVSETMQVSRQWSYIFKALKEIYLELYVKTENLQKNQTPSRFLEYCFCIACSFSKFCLVDSSPFCILTSDLFPLNRAKLLGSV